MSLSKRLPIFLLRLLAFGATVSAAVVMVTSHDSAQVLNMNFKAKYTNSPTFKYFVAINAIADGVTQSYYCFLLPRLRMGRFACLAIGQVGTYGNNHAGWLPICGQVPKFCDHVTAAMIAAFVAALAYFFILLYSLYSVKNLTLTS